MTRTREGELFALLLSVLESLFPILAVFAIARIGAIHAYSWIILFATVALVIVLGIREGYRSLFKRDAQKDLLLTSLFIAAMFMLIFLGLQYTTAGNTAVIITVQLFFSYLYFNIFGSESMTRMHTVGAFLMGAGAVIILLPTHFAVNTGDLLVLAAAAIAPLANLYQKRARRHVSAVTILAYRNIVALPFLFLLGGIFEPIPTSENFFRALPYLIGIALLVYVLAKILWIEALHRIGITKLSAMIAFMPVFTLFFAYGILGEIPSLREMIGICPVLVGAWIITRPE